MSQDADGAQAAVVQVQGRAAGEHAPDSAHADDRAVTEEENADNLLTDGWFHSHIGLELVLLVGVLLVVILILIVVSSGSRRLGSLGSSLSLRLGLSLALRTYK